MKFHRQFQAFSALLAIILAPETSQADSHTLAVECARAQITVVSFQRGKAPSSESEINFCREYPEELESLAADFRKHLQEIAGAHERLEKLTGMRFGELFKSGFHLNFTIDVDGPFVSHYVRPPGDSSVRQPPSLTLGLFRTLTSEANLGVYVHEMGHALIDALQEAGHPMGVLSGHATLNEGLADLLAYSIHGTVLTPGGGLQGCFLDFRDYRMMLSYRGSALRFSVALPARTRERCCRLSRLNRALSAEETQLCRRSSHSDSREWVNRIETRYRNMRLESLIPPFSDEAEELLDLLDSHQMALPWLTWTVDLARKQEMPPYMLIEKFFREGNPAVMREGLCTVMNGSETISRLEVKLPSMRRLVEALGTAFPEESARMKRQGFHYGSEVADILEIRNLESTVIWDHRDNPAVKECFLDQSGESLLTCQAYCELKRDAQDR